MTDPANEKLTTLRHMLQQLEQTRAQFKEIEDLRNEMDLALIAEENITNFRKRLADIFADPNPAFEKFANISASRGAENAAEDMTNNPDAYGSLKGWSIGPLANPVRQAIVKLSLPIAARVGFDGFSAHIRAGGGSYRREDLSARVQRRKEALDAKEAQIGLSGRRIDMELELAEFAKDVSFKDLATLPKEEYRTVELLRDKYRNLIQNREGDPAVRKAKGLAGQPAKK